MLIVHAAWKTLQVALGVFGALATRAATTTPLAELADMDDAQPESPPDLADQPRPSGAPGFEIRSRLNNKCLEILNTNTDNGAQVGMWDCHGGANQRWNWNGEELRSDLNNKCLEILNSFPWNGARVGVWDCHGGANQRWHWDGELLRSNLHDKCLEILNTIPWNGAWVGVWDCHWGANQLWYTK